MKHIPQRTCVACSAKKAQGELLRIVSQGGAPAQIDVRGRAPGRGAYICRQAACVEKAWARRSLERALKLQNPVEATLKAEILSIVAASDKTE